MTLNPVEKLNVFDPRLQKELRNRSFSKNLVQVRAPFLRFTTAADMSTLEDIPESPTANYNGCKYFTLGLHGWDNKNYSAADLYGTKSTNGLLVGTTYNQSDGTQRLVFTHGGSQRVSYAPTPSSAGTVTGVPSNAGASTITAAQSSQNFPPPGITSAKVERLRNGNVLKFTIETQCYTQEQLEMLDLICFIPGMTCILEWGTVVTTPNTTGAGLITLDFKSSQVDNHIRTAFRASRKSFMDQWCEPNKYNYDWAVANIANIKTRLENDVYKITVVAYGRADNLMYISAYATSNTLNENQIDENEEGKRAVTEYFKPNGAFSTFLKDVVDVQYDNGNVLRFYDPVDRAERPQESNTSSDTGTTNDFGLEDTYFINFGYFIDVVLNKHIVDIINKSTNPDTIVNRILSPLVDGEDVITVGYNAHLRSTNPETMIIFNSTAIALAEKRANTAGTQLSLINSLQRMDGNGNYSYNTTSGEVSGDTALLGSDRSTPIYEVMRSRRFGGSLSSPSADTSGTVPLTTGVWLNSKGIQQVFINARTIMEGIEALLRNVNAATENYWDLKLFFDDDRQEFRILDDNTRQVEIKTDDTVYEFNRKLGSFSTPDNGTDVLGPDVLDITVSTDYPKMLFSQLAVSGINGGNLISSPQRKDADFLRRTSVKDLFSRAVPTVEGASTTVTTKSYGRKDVGEAAAILSNALYRRSDVGFRTGELYGEIERNLTSFWAVNTGNGGGLSGELISLLQEIFSIRTFLTEAQAFQYRTRFDSITRQGLLTAEQADQVRKLLAVRTKFLINLRKNEEQRAIEAYFKLWNDRQTNDTKLPSDIVTNQDLNSSSGTFPNLREFTRIEQSRRALVGRINALTGVTG